ncbi:MAG: hypothetical protein FWB80_00975 [Defluviitaleaceae bacterium]|nr:hypothetical protein [Defluviitaleaceae bacterium]
MAMINCPECSVEVSDMAQTCAKCSFPIASLRTDGEIRIKMMDKKADDGSVGSQAVANRIKYTIKDTATNVELWKGTSAEIARFYLKEPTEVEILAKGFGYKLHGIVRIDPKKCKTYQIAGRPKNFFLSMFGLSNTIIIELVELDFIA